MIIETNLSWIERRRMAAARRRDRREARALFGARPMPTAEEATAADERANDIFQWVALAAFAAALAAALFVKGGAA